MSVLGAAGEYLFPKLIQNTKTQNDDHKASKQILGSSALEYMFPNLYTAKEKQRNVRSQKQTDIAQSVNVLAEEVNASNELIAQSIAMQKQQNALLAQILNGIKAGGLSQKQNLLDEVLSALPFLGSRPRLLPGGSKGASPKETIIKEKAKPSEKYKYNEKTKRWHDTKTNKMVSAAEALGEKAEQKVAQKAEKKFSMASIQKFIKYIALKKGKEYALKIGAKLTLAAGAAATGVGAIFDLFFIALNVYDAYEVYQLWQEFSAAGEPTVPEAQKQDATKALEGTSGEGPVKISPDGSRVITGSVIQFTGKDILFAAREMTIKAKSVVKGIGTALPANSEASEITAALTGPGGVGEHLGGPKSVEQGDGKPIIGVPRLTRITAKKSKVSTSIGEPYASNFQGLLDDLEATGYNIKTLGGYANRANKADSSKLSFHALGAALDINAATNPWDSTRTDMPPNISSIAALHGLGWGMKFRKHPDPMHFSAAKNEYGGFNISQMPMRGYASGTDYVPTTGPAIVGEKGSELIVGKDGVKVTPGQATVVNLNQGDKVIPHDPAAMDLNQKYSGYKVERSGSYMSRPHFFDTAEKMYAAMGDRPAGNITDKQDRESYEVIAAFQRGEKPPKPDSMTDKEYMNRMKDYGAMAVLKGNITIEELQKATKQAEQPAWQIKAQNKTAEMVKNSEQVRSPTGEKMAVKPLIAPANTNAADFARMDYVEPKAPPPPPPELSDAEMREQAWRQRGRTLGGRPSAYNPPPNNMGAPSGNERSSPNSSNLSSSKLLGAHVNP